VKVLRDTVCKFAVVRKKLVDEDQMLNKNCVMIAIDGRARLVPMAKIDIDTPYYKGEIEAMVLESAICDLVIGNIQGVLDKPNEKWVSREVTNIAAVATRAQAEKEKKAMKPLKVPKVEDNETRYVCKTCMPLSAAN
jgi:hypothetical protein